MTVGPRTNSGTAVCPVAQRRASASPEIARARTTWMSLFALFLGAFAVGTDGFMIAGLLPRIAHDFHTVTPVAAQGVTVFAIGYAVGAPVLASLLHHLDRRVVLTAALAALAATNLAAALSPTLTGLFLARIGAALSAGMYAPTAAVVAAGLTSQSTRGRALSVVTAGLTVSIVTGVPLGNLVGDLWGWRATFTSIAVLALVLAATVAIILPTLPTADTATTIRQRLAAANLTGVPRVLVTTVLGILAGYLGYTYVAPISQAMGATSNRSLAVVLLGFGIGAALGAFLAGVGVDRYGQATAVRTGALIQALALAALAVGDATHAHLGTAPAAAAFTLLGAGSWSYNAPQQHRLVDLAPHAASTVVSLNSSAVYAGIGLSATLGALTVPAGPTLTCLTGLLIAVATAVTAGDRNRRPPPAPPGTDSALPETHRPDEAH